VLYAPGLPDLDAIRAVCAAVKRPVNVLAGGQAGVSVAELSACGVQRVSVGPALARVALSATFHAAKEIAEHGTFGYATGVLSYGEITRLCTDPGSR
jgi:2-methylisocitrate lyase-like PEP mutase family enzyme